MTTRRGFLAGALPAAMLAGMLWEQPAGAAVALPYFAPSNFFSNGEWTLPKLSYDYAALEPHIDSATMELHHSKHHKAYVTNLNKALKTMNELKADEADPRVVESLQRDISFNMGGHALHSTFWGIMGPDSKAQMGGEPSGTIATAITNQFGGFANFKTYFTQVAMSIKGSGWAVLALSPVSRQLVTMALKDQDGSHAAGTLPVLLVDVWEHAYYLKYQNRRADYVAAWFNTINWSAVNMLMGG
jgi:superoxide dismutase, Fe-Mn family